MIRPWVMPYSIVNFTVWVSGPFGAEFPYCPVGAVFVVKEFDKTVGRVAVGTLRVGGGGARRRDDSLQLAIGSNSM